MLKFVKSALITLTTAGAVVFGLSGAASAQDKIGDYTDWAVYEVTEGGNRVCFMTSQPKKSQGKYTKRDQVFFLINHRPGVNENNVTQFIAGYNLKENSKVNVNIDARRTFPMFTQGDSAWALDSDDSELIKAMVRGNSMVIKGTSWRGTLTTDTFSLSGFTKAYRAMSQACNVKPVV